jgi:hypothetical protein
MELEHRERRQWVEEIAKINRRLNDEDQPDTGDSWS